MSTPQRLGLSGELAEELWSWAGWWDQHSAYGGGATATALELSEWDGRGVELARRLAAALGPGTVVVYRWPYGPAGGDPRCPHCGSFAAVG